MPKCNLCENRLCGGVDSGPGTEYEDSPSSGLCCPDCLYYADGEKCDSCEQRHLECESGENGLEEGNDILFTNASSQTMAEIIIVPIVSLIALERNVAPATREAWNASKTPTTITCARTAFIRREARSAPVVVNVRLIINGRCLAAIYARNVTMTMLTV